MIGPEHIKTEKGQKGDPGRDGFPGMYRAITWHKLTIFNDTSRFYFIDTLISIRFFFRTAIFPKMIIFLP